MNRNTVAFLLILTVFFYHGQPLKSFKDENGKFGFKKLVYSETWNDFILGDELIPAKYDSVALLNKPVVTSDYDLYTDFVYGFACVKLGNNWGYLDSNGHEITKIQYEKIWPFDKGFAPVQKNGKIGFINTSGKEIIACNYDDSTLVYDWNKMITPLHEGLFKVRLNRKWGFIDSTGTEVIKPIYFNVGNFSEGLAWVKLNEDSDYGYIDRNGKYIIPASLHYEKVYDFKNKKAAFEVIHIEDDGNLMIHQGFINRAGDVISPAKPK